jgi:hypothetical protein
MLQFTGAHSVRYKSEQTHIALTWEFVVDLLFVYGCPNSNNLICSRRSLFPFDLKKSLGPTWIRWKAPFCLQLLRDSVSLLLVLCGSRVSLPRQSSDMKST